MEIIISTKELKNKIADFNSFIPKNPSMPSLSNIVLDISKAGVRVIATNLKVYAIAYLDCKFKGAGSVLIDYSRLISTIKLLPEQPITIKCNNNFEVTLEAENSTYRLTGENPIDFPKTPVVLHTGELEINSNDLGNALEMCLPFASKDELRPAMTGIYFGFGEGVIASTDAHVLVTYNINIEEAGHIILCQEAALYLKKVVTGDSIKIAYNREYIEFKIGEHLTVIGKVIDERYPSFQSVIPDNNFKLEINRKDLLTTIKRIKPFVSSITYQCEFNMSEEEGLIVTGKDWDYGNECKEQVNATYNGEQMQIGLNVKFLMTILPKIKDNDLVFSFSSPDKPALIQADDKPFLFLVMPIMIQEYA